MCSESHKCFCCNLHNTAKRTSSDLKMIQQFYFSCFNYLQYISFYLNLYNMSYTNIRQIFYSCLTFLKFSVCLSRCLKIFFSLNKLFSNFSSLLGDSVLIFLLHHLIHNDYNMLELLKYFKITISEPI